MDFSDPEWQDLKNSEKLTMIGHPYFICKDKNMRINWKKPYL